MARARVVRGMILRLTILIVKQRLTIRFGRGQKGAETRNLQSVRCFVADVIKLKLLLKILCRFVTVHGNAMLVIVDAGLALLLTRNISVNGVNEQGFIDNDLGQ
jgi:hypothetical protein